MRVTEARYLTNNWQIDPLSHDLFFFGDILREGWFYQDCLLKYKSIRTKQDLLIFWRGLTLNGENPNLIMAWNWHVIYLRPKEVNYKICYDLSWKATNSKHLYWDTILKIAQDSACDTFPGSRSYLMKRFKLFFGEVLREWLLKQDVWLTILFISKQLLVKSLHDQDQIWWKVSNISSETFLGKVDLSKIVNLSDSDIF